MEIVKEKIIINDEYRIVKLANNAGMFAITDINGKKTTTEDITYKGLFIAQMLIKDNWNFISEGINPITKKPLNPQAFPTIKLCEEYILDFHTRYANLVKQTNKNL